MVHNSSLREKSRYLRITVFICTYNRGNLINGTLEELINNQIRNPIEKILILVERLLVIPYAYTFQNEYENSTINYCRNKYLLLNNNVFIFNNIHLWDGLIGDLGFDNWFDQSLIHKLYQQKNIYIISV